MVCNVDRTTNNVLRLYYPSHGQHLRLQNLKIKKNLEEFIFGKNIESGDYFSLEIECEICFHLVFDNENVDFTKNFLDRSYDKINWLFGNNSFQPILGIESQLSNADIQDRNNFCFEIGPR